MAICGHEAAATVLSSTTPSHSTTSPGVNMLPLVFPLLAGPGSFTTLLSLRAEFAAINITIALILNMVWVYIVLTMTSRIEHLLGKGGIYMLRKFFGIILLAISVRLFTANISQLMEQLGQ